MKVNNLRILRLNLTHREIQFEHASRYGDYIGGRGINQCILFHEMPMGVSPLEPSSLLAIGAGLLCGTEAPGAARLSIDTKNLFTGGIGSSNVGGNFGPALKRAGISNVIISGRSLELSYIKIDNGRVEICDASYLKRKTISHTERLLKADLGEEFQVMAIGPAGENLVWPACVVVNGSRVAGRCGAGAVFGSKNLKAIAVRGTSEIEPVDKELFSEVVERCLTKMSTSSLNCRRMQYGVYCSTEPWGIESPYKNFSGEVPPLEKKTKLMPDMFLHDLAGRRGCDSCPISCWTTHEFTDARGQIFSSDAFQANAVHNFGARLDMDDPHDILRAHQLCDEMGLDEDVTSSVIAWATTCYEKGILSSDDIDGLSLEWGNAGAVFELIRKIAHRDGFGDVLSKGCELAAEAVGAGSEFCVTVKGNDLFECLWMRPAWALGVVVSPRGGTHTRGALIESRLQGISPELCMKLFRVPSIGDVSSYTNKEKLVIYMEQLNAAIDALGMCMFTHSYTTDMLLPDDYAQLLAAAIGKDITGEKLLLLGERLHTLEKCFNVLHTNWTRKDDLPPDRFVTVPLAGTYRIDLVKWNELLDRYYDQHGWDKTTSWPTKETLLALRLGALCEKLCNTGVAL